MTEIEPALYVKGAALVIDSGATKWLALIDAVELRGG